MSNHNHDHDNHLNKHTIKEELCCIQSPDKHIEKHLTTEGNNVLEHHHTVKEELLCHLPYAIFSVALSLMFLSFMSNLSDLGGSSGHGHDSIAYHLFHNFHYLHLLFAGTGTILMFRKYSKNTILGLIVGITVPAVFCTLSDAILPYLGGQLVHLDMHFHWCFIYHLDTVLPFLLVGILNGWVMSQHEKSRQLFYSIGFHFFHIFISSMASILYLISFGFQNWSDHMSFVFLYIIVAVLIPCTLADIVVPIFFARLKKYCAK